MISHATLSRRMDNADIELQLFWRNRADEFLAAAIQADQLASAAKQRAGQRNGIDPAQT